MQTQKIKPNHVMLMFGKQTKVANVECTLKSFENERQL
jgi:hypothetical protein